MLEEWAARENTRKTFVAMEIIEHAQCAKLFLFINIHLLQMILITATNGLYFIFNHYYKI